MRKFLRNFLGLGWLIKKKRKTTELTDPLDFFPRVKELGCTLAKIGAEDGKAIGPYLPSPEGSAKRETEQIVTPGSNPSHKHKFSWRSWDKERFGAEVVDIGDYYATYKDLYLCTKCGTEKIVSKRAFV